MPNVGEIMTSPPTTVTADTQIVEVAKRMRDDDIGTVVVTDGDKLDGVVTDRDLVVRGIAENADPHGRVGDMISESTVSVTRTDDVATAVTLMREHAVRRLPVVDGSQVVGIVSIGDIAVQNDERSALADISAATPNT